VNDTLSEMGAALARNWPMSIGVALVATAGFVRFASRSVGQRRLAFSDYGKARDEYLGLRKLALEFTPGDLGLSAPEGDCAAYGVVLDWGHPKAIATITGFNSGDASLYLSTGGGVLGGVGHARVREAARALVAEAQKRLPRMTLTSDFPLPKIGRAKIYALTGRGIFADDVRIDPIEPQVADFWDAGQRLLYEVRTARPSKDAAPLDAPAPGV
jgi:hypothetical protein